MDNDLLKEAVNDALSLPDEDKLGRLTALARTQLQIEREIEDIENKLASRKDALKQVQERDIPELMMSIGARGVTLLDGRKLEIKPFYSGKIDEGNTDAYDWLEENGYGDIVKVTVAVKTTASNQERIDKIRKTLHDAGIEWDETSGVHHQTLNAWIKEVISAGKHIDRQLFNVYTGWRSKIK